MNILEEINQVSFGANFYRSDLHIHSYGGSLDVSDTNLTPKAIVETAESENISICAITDHNEIINVKSGIQEGLKKNIVIIPGVELSTPEGHLLVYFESIEDLSDFFGKLTIVEKATNNARCQTSMLDCLNLIEKYNGIGVLAHVDGSNGLELKIPKMPPHKLDILCHKALLGIEVRDSSSPVTYAEGDPEEGRVRVSVERQKRLGTAEREFLARTLFSDAHTLEGLGKNAKGNRRITRFKMDSPSFQGLRIALLEPDSRVRIEDEIPQSVPFIKGIKIVGGFLDDTIIRFNQNLNCIIGGRGAGKSTAIESATCLSYKEHNSKLLDSEACPMIYILSGQIRLVKTKLFIDRKLKAL